MDPDNHSTKYSLSPDFADKDEGTNYLRRLKETPADRSPADAKADNGSKTLTANKAAEAPPTIGAVSSFKERRQSPRFCCSGRVQMRVEGADYRMWGTLTDVSLHGCYVEMNNTFPIGTKLDMELDAISIKVKLPGVVRATYPFLGMGICFGEIEFNQLAQLQNLLLAIVGRKSSFGASAR